MNTQMTGVSGRLDESIRRNLHEGWTVRAVGGPVPDALRDAVGKTGIAASVPGCIHTDLLAAGLIPDPYLDDHERLVAWVELCDWEYRTTFSWTADGHDRHDLAFDGLDTVATICLNGAQIGKTVNMHRSYRFDVGSVLTEGDNELVVTFASPVRYADAESLNLGYRPATNQHPFNAIRKMACAFGWDWGPDLATSGIWKAVRLESWSQARVSGVRPLARVEGTTGIVEIHVDVERATVPVEVVARVAGQSATATIDAGAETVIRIEVPDVQQWWPRGYGDQPLYDVEVEARTDKTIRDTWSGRIGFRNVRLEMEPDDQGTSFRFVVNDVPVFVRGANWIPDDCFPHRVTRERYAARLDQAEFAHINLLRVWGGGIYEADDFYDLADERGILTWQDFLFACAAYAEEDPLRSEIEAEARENVSRLSRHPSLVLWNGSNENIWGYHDWGWEKRLDGKTWGVGYYTELLPAIVAELDGRPYTASSPWSGTLDIYPNDPRHGSMHSWKLWNEIDYLHYRDAVPRFLSEFGWQGPPAWSTLTRALSDDPLTPESPGMVIHQKALKGNDKLTDGLLSHMSLPDDMDDWHWAMSLNQAMAVRLGIEHVRSVSPVCMGSVVWQINDCWPVVSWAAVDGDGRPKPLLYALRQAYTDRMVTLQPRQAGVDGRAERRTAGELTASELTALAAVVVNDCAEPWAGALVMRRMAFDGTVLAAAEVEVSVGARDVVEVTVPDDVALAGDSTRELVVAEVRCTADCASDHGPVRGLWFPVEPRDSDLDAAAVTATAQQAVDGYEVRVQASGLVRELTVLADKVAPDAVVDQAMVTLLPGESATFRVRTTAEVDPAAFTAPNVLRSLNQLV